MAATLSATNSATLSATNSATLPATNLATLSATNQVAPATVALLKLCCDPPLWKVASGCVSPSVLDTLYPFHVEVVLLAPRAVNTTQVASPHVVSYENGWFSCSFHVAVSVFCAVVSPLETDIEIPDLETDSPDVPLETDIPDVRLETDIEIQGVSFSETGEIWEYVSPSAVHTASKATVIRSTLITKLGKQRASELLSKTKMGVTKDGQGLNIRVLKMGGVTLKLK